jgi:hypothetical protein
MSTTAVTATHFSFPGSTAFPTLAAAETAVKAQIKAGQSIEISEVTTTTTVVHTISSTISEQ